MATGYTLQFTQNVPVPTTELARIELPEPSVIRVGFSLQTDLNHPYVTVQLQLMNDRGTATHNIRVFPTDNVVEHVNVAAQAVIASVLGFTPSDKGSLFVSLAPYRRG